MFGISLVELLVLLVVFIIFIKPQDLPEVMRFVGKIIYKLRKIYHQSKDSFDGILKNIGFEELKKEIDRDILEEGKKLEEDFTVIVDVNGNEHKVPNSNIKQYNPHLSDEQLKDEVTKLNQKNTKKN